MSVVIPVYNARGYLDECIASALAQTHSDTEIVAVDDGSTDGSAEVLDGYADRISVHRKPNGGTASALNYARARMTGDWFKWLSADDLLRPSLLLISSNPPLGSGGAHSLLAWSRLRTGVNSRMLPPSGSGRSSCGRCAA